jgi:hypothetical protein
MPSIFGHTTHLQKPHNYLAKAAGDALAAAKPKA